MKTLLFPTGVITEINNVDIMHYRQNSKNSLLATTRAASCLVYNLHLDLVFQVAMTHKHPHTIENANVINLPPGTSNQG